MADFKELALERMESGPRNHNGHGNMSRLYLMLGKITGTCIFGLQSEEPVPEWVSST
jgi:hypothetical protein